MNKPGNSQEAVSLETARTSLTTLWLLGSGVPFLVVVVQSMLGKYGDKLQQIWSWFLPTVLPTVLLMLGVLASGAFLDSAEDRLVKASFLRLAKGLSYFYLGILLLTLLIQPFVNSDKTSAVQLYLESNYWLGPLQGVVAGVIGVLFTTQHSKRPSSQVDR